MTFPAPNAGGAGVGCHMRLIEDNAMAVYDGEGGEGEGAEIATRDSSTSVGRIISRDVFGSVAGFADAGHGNPRNQMAQRDQSHG